MNRASSQSTSAASRGLDLFDSVLTSIEKKLLIVTIVSLIGVMLLVAADALGRYFFNSPIIITIYFVAHYVLPLIMLLPASYVLRQSKHISVDMFSMLMPERVTQFVMGVGMAFVLPIIWIMAYRVGHTGLENFYAGKVAYGVVPWPFWLEQAIYFVCFMMLTLRALHVSISNLVAAVTGNSDIAISMVNKHDNPMGEAD